MIQLNNIIYKMFTSIFNYLFNLTANFNSSSLYLDAPEPWQIGFQDPASPGFEGIIALHDSILFYLVLISVSVFWLIFSLIRHFSSTKTGIIHKYLNHSTVLELIWTVSPAFILVAIAFPSFKLLYTLDEVIDPALTVKVTGHQWYWTYEYSDMLSESGDSIELESYLIPESDLEEGQLRLLEVDNRIVVPSNTHVRVIVTGADVIHSWAVPSLGVKVDAIPGRLNQTYFMANREGIYYGQCSELCGVNHAFMPITVEVTDVEHYCQYMIKLIEEA